MYPPGEAHPREPRGAPRTERAGENVKTKGAKKREEPATLPNLISVHDCPQRGHGETDHSEARESEGHHAEAAGHRHLHLERIRLSDRPWTRKLYVEKK